jgi:hypothetical protein
MVQWATDAIIAYGNFVRYEGRKMAYMYGFSDNGGETNIHMVKFWIENDRYAHWNHDKGLVPFSNIIVMMIHRQAFYYAENSIARRMFQVTSRYPSLKSELSWEQGSSVSSHRMSMVAVCDLLLLKLLFG